MTDLERRLYAELKELRGNYQRDMQHVFSDAHLRSRFRDVDTVLREYEAKAEAEVLEALDP